MVRQFHTCGPQNRLLGPPIWLRAPWSYYLASICLLASCATNPLSSARFWNLDVCASAASGNVRFTRADGSEIAVIPRRSCQAVHAASEKIQSASNFRLSRVLIADLDSPNAFATHDKSGNPIAVVTVGMLSALGGDEEAWAGLLGHEIAHLVKRHGEGRREAQASARGAGNVIGNVIAYSVPGVGGWIGGTVAGTATQMAVYGNYTRPQEAEADQLGLEWMVRAGYDPRGLSRLFEVLGKSASLPAFLSTHPAASDRAQMVEAYIARTGRSPAQSIPPIAIAQAIPPVTTTQVVAAVSGGESRATQAAIPKSDDKQATHSRDYFAAIAYSTGKRAYGWAKDHASRDEAEAAALVGCSKHARDCSVVLWFKNACGALSFGPRGAGWGSADSQADAASRAVDACTSRSSGCVVKEQFCTSWGR